MYTNACPRNFAKQTDQKRPTTTSTKTSEGLDMKDKGKQNDFSHSISSREGE